ncbi:hypothetical protein M405DRAFT_830294 [Rhizopogon salebrosus TDB-379]|nr:hypothetical protein M405DRAFT_830294 [Rhizopogon salebrosus TDB-379]
MLVELSRAHDEKLTILVVATSASLKGDLDHFQNAVPGCCEAQGLEGGTCRVR